jgi:hypothetical protein
VRAEILGCERGAESGRTSPTRRRASHEKRSIQRGEPRQARVIELTNDGREVELKFVAFSEL